MADFFSKLAEKACMPEEYSALDLAYIGDAVFELCVRSRLLADGARSVKSLNTEAKKFVSAPAQSKMFHRLFDLLTEEEQGVVKRGRNAKSYTKPKSASITEYRHATGVEALFGYLYLNGNTDRIIELFEKCFISEEKKDEAD